MDEPLPSTDAPNAGCNRGNTPFILLLAATLLGCGGYGAFLAYRQVELLGWPATAADITEFDPGEPEPGSGANWFRSPTVRFEYVVEGVRYVGTGMNPSPFNYQSRRQFDNDTAELKAGAKVECWYNPDSPAESYVVNAGVSPAPMILLTIALLSLCVLVKAVCTPVSPALPAKPEGMESSRGKQAVKYGCGAAFLTFVAGIVGLALIVFAIARSWRSARGLELTLVGIGAAVGMIVHVMVAS